MSISEQIKAATTRAELDAAIAKVKKASKEYASPGTIRKWRRLLENPRNNLLK
jgi:hypothetical protein